MTNDEIKKALLMETPAIHNDIEYKQISAVIYRKKGNTIKISVELLDKNERSVVIADPDNVTPVNQDENGSDVG